MSAPSAAGALPTHKELLVAPGQPFIHRDLSWLQFNERVLAEADEPTTPLLERVKFLAISSSNLDEFFMIRFASLGRSIRRLHRKEMHAEAKQLKRIQDQIIGKVLEISRRQKTALRKLARELAPEKIFGVLPGEPIAKDPRAIALGKELFDQQILPQLDRTGTEGGFRRLRQIGELGNLQTAAVFAPEQVWIPVPKSLPSVIRHTVEETGEIFVFFLDQLLLEHLGGALGMKNRPTILRLTRDGDLTVDLEEEDTIPDVVRSSIGTRDRGRPVRLQCLGECPKPLLEMVSQAIRVHPNAIFVAADTVLLHGLWSLANNLPERLALNPVLCFPPVRPVIPPWFEEGRPIFESLRQRDLLLHHPYDSFDAFVRFIQEACADKDVTQIELTVYRTDVVSPVVDALKAAAATKKKKIRVAIELRARFDELNNLRLAEELRRAGIEVAFGFGQLKLHAKIALVTRFENGSPSFYTHLSTGNYNAVTARQYTDIAILTGNSEIGADARLFFDSIWKGEVPVSFRRLVSAPARLRRRIISLIEMEIKAAENGKQGRIFAKVNALVDETVIRSLYRASQAGVRVDLVVRGACSLIPGVPGLSENIRVISVVDRFLEHSRLYYFESSRAMYLSSADWMPRNFFSRLEIAFPVLDARIFEFIEKIVIPTYLADTVKARELTPNGLWRPRSRSKREEPVRSQSRLQELAALGYRSTPLA